MEKLGWIQSIDPAESIRHQISDVLSDKHPHSWAFCNQEPLKTPNHLEQKLRHEGENTPTSQRRMVFHWTAVNIYRADESEAFCSACAGDYSAGSIPPGGRRKMYALKELQGVPHERVH